MPSAVKMAKEYGGDLAVLLVEVQGSSDTEITSMQLQKKWLGGYAMWTTERPFNVGMDGIPHYALLDPSGKVVMTGYSARDHSRVVDKIDEMLKAAKKPSKDLSPKIAKAISKLNDGDIGAAHAAVAKLLANPPRTDTDRVMREAKMAEARIVQKADSEIARVRWMMDNGYAHLAKERVADLAGEFSKMEDHAARCAALKTDLASADMANEIAASAKLAKLEDKFFEDSGGKFKKSFASLAEKFPGTQAAKRAQYWSGFAQ